MNDASMQGRVAIVTGGSRGLGRAIAVSLARRGASVGLNYWASPELAAKAVEEIAAAGGKAIAVKADVRDPDQVRELTEKTREAFGAIDIVVANATGPQPFQTIEEQSWQSYLDQLEFFVKSPLLLVQATVAEMKSRRWGRIIQIGSEVVEVGHPFFANYVAAKGAQLGQTRSWARELAPWQITVNLVAPGWIPTERHAGTAQQDLDSYAARVPLERQGVPGDVGEAVAYLASESANFVTGQKLAVNGGHTLL